MVGDVPLPIQFGTLGMDHEAEKVAMANERRRARKAKPVVVFKLKEKTYRLTAQWAKLAMEAHERFRGIGYSAYNKAVVSRWIDLKVAGMQNVRWADRRANIPLIELYVWYITDAEADLAETFAELRAEGRVRMELD